MSIDLDNPSYRTRDAGTFREDALADVGLAGHPKADKAFQMAWDYGHSSGVHEVYYYLVELADLLIEED